MEKKNHYICLGYEIFSETYIQKFDSVCETHRFLKIHNLTKSTQEQILQMDLHIFETESIINDLRKQKSLGQNRLLNSFTF